MNSGKVEFAVEFEKTGLDDFVVAVVVVTSASLDVLMAGVVDSG